MNVLARFFDERFFAHRRQSTSAAGILCALLALALFAWRGFVNHAWNWDLLAVALAFVAVKLALMLWYALTD